jgi:NTP pyrophosphatase (non-canonical NTP hydrolase)
MKTSDNKCYVLADGECVSPFECIHGDGLSLDEFVKRVQESKTLNNYAHECHVANMKWWTNMQTGEKLERNKGELLMLMVSEIAEAMEGERKDLQDDKLPNRKMAEVELADCLIRIFDYSAAFGYDLEGAYQEKMKFNAQREDHKHEARQLAGGKKW